MALSGSSNTSGSLEQPEEHGGRDAGATNTNGKANGDGVVAGGGGRDGGGNAGASVDAGAGGKDGLGSLDSGVGNEARPPGGDGGDRRGDGGNDPPDGSMRDSGAGFWQSLPPRSPTGCMGYEQTLPALSVGSKWCGFPIPDTSEEIEIHLTRINIYLSYGGSSHTLPAVSDASRCEDAVHGWYYDDPVDPANIIVCEATCGALQTLVPTTAIIEYGCATLPAGP